MARNQRDEPVIATITAATDTSATDQKAPINETIDVLVANGMVGAKG
jgi:hypothetical protein